jgi:hypothetical protein
MRLTPLLAAGALIVGAQAAHAQAATSNQISGRVFDDSTGCPLAHAQVSVLGGTLHTTTNQQGRYYLPKSSPQMVSLQAMLSGYASKQTDSISPGDEGARVDFSLERSPMANARTHYPSAQCHLEPTGAAADSGGKG